MHVANTKFSSRSVEVEISRNIQAEMKISCQIRSSEGQERGLG